MFPGQCFICGVMGVCEHREPDLVRLAHERLLSLLRLAEATERKPPTRAVTEARETLERSGS